MKLATLCYIKHNHQTFMLHRITKPNDIHTLENETGWAASSSRANHPKPASSARCVKNPGWKSTSRAITAC